MENASKALIMAASVILGVMLMAIMVYVFRAGASLDEAYDAKQVVRQLQLFNSKLEVYDKQDNTIMDILTVINLVYSINKDYNYDFAKSIELIIKAGDKYFVVPMEKPKKISDGTNKYERNKIFVRKNLTDKDDISNVISSYDLANKTLKELELKGIGVSDAEMQSDKLITTRLASKQYKNEWGKNIIKSNVTVYKYVFFCKCVCGATEHAGNGIYYHPTTGRVKNVEFELKINPEWDTSTDKYIADP